MRGYSANDAARTLQQDGFAVTLVRRFDNTVKDNVIDQAPKPGGQGSRRQPRHLGRFGWSRAGDRSQLRRNEGRKRAVKSERTRRNVGYDAERAGHAADTIASQSIAAGTKLDRNATVHVVVNSGTPLSTAPPAGTGPLTNLPKRRRPAYTTAALQALITAGFQLTLRRAKYVQR